MGEIQLKEIPSKLFKKITNTEILNSCLILWSWIQIAPHLPKFSSGCRRFFAASQWLLELKTIHQTVHYSHNCIFNCVALAVKHMQSSSTYYNYIKNSSSQLQPGVKMANHQKKLIHTSGHLPSSSHWWDLKDCLFCCCQRFKWGEAGFDDPWPSGP